MNCIFTKQDDRLVCTQCGFSMRYREGNVLRNCTADQNHPAEKVPEFPSLAQQAIHFASDMIQWGQAGFPVSKRDERERKIEICRGCEMFADGRCSECGCACGWASFLETKQCPHPSGDKWEKDRLERIEHAVPQQ